MKRAILFAVATAVGAGVTGCGSVHARVSEQSRTHGSPPISLQTVPLSPTALRFSAASNRAFAQRDVEKLIRMVVLPQSAKRVPKVPKSAPSWFRMELSANLVGGAVAHRAWVVDAPLKTVVRYFRTHAQPHPRPKTGFPKSATRVGSRPSDHWDFGPVPGRSSDRWLNVAMLALPNGATVVTAQAGDEWIHPLPASAEIPGTVKRIDITSRYGHAAPRVRLRVRNRDVVTSVVAWINGLGVTQGHFTCAGGLFGEPTITLTFRDARGMPIARGVYDSNGASGCMPFSLAVHGKRTPRLTPGDLLQRIERLLNADFSPPRPRQVSRCLRGLGWHVQTTTDRLTARKSGLPRTITFHMNGKVTRTGPRSQAIFRCLRRSPSVVYLG